MPLSFVVQPEVNIPVVKETDVLIVGGTTAAVSAAVAIAECDQSVMLVTSKPYLGEDICATLNLDKSVLESIRVSELARFQETEFEPTPLYVKSLLSSCLEKNGIEILYGSYPTDVLFASEDKISGLVIGNRAGRQFIKAKIIVDATKRASVCRIAGADAYESVTSTKDFSRNLIYMVDGDTILENRKLPILSKDYSYKSLSNLEQQGRDLTYSENCLRGAEVLSYLSPDPIRCKKHAYNFQGYELEYFQTIKSDFLFVLGECADIPREEVKKLNQDYTKLIRQAKDLGVQIAAFSKRVKPNTLITQKENQVTNKRGIYDIRERLEGLRSVETVEEKITIKERKLPVWGNYDVIVVGGGTAGAPAAIAAARAGVKVLVIEYLEGLGGTGTLGMIGKPYFGKKTGFAASVPFPDHKKYSIEKKMEWYRSELRKAGADIWLGSLVSGVLIEGDKKVSGVVVLTPDGRGVVKAGVVIDATGNGDVAIVAGASYRYGEIEKGRIALQGSGMPSRPLIGTYYNTDYLLVDDVDMVDVSNVIDGVLQVKAKEKQYDVGPIIQNRERRRIIGETTISYVEQIAGRNYEDVVVYSHSDYDSHGYPNSLYFALLPHDSISAKKNHPAPGGYCHTPYRALIPKGLDGILVVGIAISMDRDVTALIRMQYDLANQGYAAGYAAAMAAKQNVSVRNIPIKQLQKHLVKIGNIPQSVVDSVVSFPYSESVVRQAVIDYGQAMNPEMAGKPLAIILTHREIAKPFLKQAFFEFSGQKKIAYAKILAVLGETVGVDLLLKELNSFTKWDMKIFQGNMACYAHLPTLQDQIITALACSGDKRVLPALLKKVEELDSSVTLSHHLAIAQGLEKIGDPDACKSLAKLLSKDGISGHVIMNKSELKQTLSDDGKKQMWRTYAFREIILARALYVCGDYNNIGKNILLAYKNDIRGLFSRHATFILDNKNVLNNEI